LIMMMKKKKWKETINIKSFDGNQSSLGRFRPKSLFYSSHSTSTLWHTSSDVTTLQYGIQLLFSLVTNCHYKSRNN
jgi:hypothetical protein